MNIRALALGLCAAGLFCAVAPGQEDAPMIRRLADYNIPGLDTKVTFKTGDAATVEAMIKVLADAGGINNLVISKNIPVEPVTMMFDDITVADALEVVLSANQLAYEIRGGVLAILTDAEYQAKYGRSFLDLKQTRILTLTYADPARVAQMLGSVKSTAGTVVADPVSGTLIVVDTPDRIAMMSEVVARTDIRTGGRIVPTETRAFQLQYADVQTIVPEIQTMLTKDVGVLKSDNRTRSILVMDLPHVLRRIEDVVRLFDRRPRQVFIEARIVEVTFNDAFSMGVNWSHIFQGINPRFSLETVGTTLGADRAAGDRTLQLNYNTIAAGGDLSLVLEALKTVGKTDILSNPQIAVLDGEEARIEVVEDQPYKEQQFEAGSTNVTGTTYLFKKVGVQLAVTPRINDEDMISIQVRPETSTISTWYDGVEQEGTPVVKQSVAETTVMVRDGVTIIIGGLKDKRVIRSSNVIPVLGQLPLIGRLFRYERSSTRDSEVVVFLTPRIVTGEQPYGIEQDRPKTIKVLKTEDSPSAPDPMPPGVAP